ncbi:hypothetical protein HMPREF9069_00522 [Atopobium sp. oral taxon 810 str. F0209]|nr:hypothetical protein HMPREF9069_00522 [Atopobium sp. oral taxon 810 str. F0209]
MMAPQRFAHAVKTAFISQLSNNTTEVARLNITALPPRNLSISEFSQNSRM